MTYATAFLLAPNTSAGGNPAFATGGPVVWWAQVTTRAQHVVARQRGLWIKP